MPFTNAGREAVSSPRQHLERVYAGSKIAIPEWLLSRRPENVREWDEFGRLLPALTLPIFRHLEITRPDRVIACARSGIPVGTSIESLAYAFGTQVPTADRRVHTLKISALTNWHDQRQHVAPLFVDAWAAAKSRPPLITVLDGVTNTGGTYRRAMKLSRQAGFDARINWASLASPDSVEKTRTTFIAWPNSNSDAIVAWEDNSNVLGVCYSADLQEVTPVADPALSAVFHRAQLLGAHTLAEVLTENGQACEWIRPHAA